MVFVCGMDVVFDEDKYVVCGVEILVHAKEVFFRLPCVCKVWVALPRAKIHVFQFGDYVGIYFAIYVDAAFGIYDVGFGIGGSVGGCVCGIVGMWRCMD